MIRTHTITVTVAGADGNAAGEGQSSPVNGLLRAVYVDYVTQPATADLTLATLAPAQTLLTLTNNATDGWYYPNVLQDNTSGADIAGVYDKLPIDDIVKATIAQGNAGSVVIYLMVEQ